MPTTGETNQTLDCIKPPVELLKQSSRRDRNFQTARITPYPLRTGNSLRITQTALAIASSLISTLTPEQQNIVLINNS
jgi:hypothetical protein